MASRGGREGFHRDGIEHDVLVCAGGLHPDVPAVGGDAEHERFAAGWEGHPLDNGASREVDFGDGVLVTLRGEAEPTVRREVQVSRELAGLDLGNDLSGGQIDHVEPIVAGTVDPGSP